MEVHAFLAEARRRAVDDEAREVEVLRAQLVALVVLLEAAQVLVAAGDLRRWIVTVSNAGMRWISRVMERVRRRQEGR